MSALWSDDCRALCDRYPKMVFEKYADLKKNKQIFFAILIAFAVVSFWRGAWGLLDIYLDVGHQELSMWLSIFIGLAILSAMHYTVKELM